MIIIYRRGISELDRVFNAPEQIIYTKAPGSIFG